MVRKQNSAILSAMIQQYYFRSPIISVQSSSLLLYQYSSSSMTQQYGTSGVLLLLYMGKRRVVLGLAITVCHTAVCTAVVTDISTATTAEAPAVCCRLSNTADRLFAWCGHSRQLLCGIAEYSLSYTVVFVFSVD